MLEKRRGKCRGNGVLERAWHFQGLVRRLKSGDAKGVKQRMEK